MTDDEQKYFWRFFETIRVPMKILNEEGVILHANGAFQSFLGFERDEMEGQEIFAFMEEQGRTKAYLLFEDLLKRDEDSGGPHPPEVERHLETDRAYLRKDGEQVWGNLYLQPLWGADGKLIHVIGLIIDVTARVRAMEEIRRREAQERAILDTTADAILVIDESGKVEALNRAGEKIFGYDTKELIGNQVYRLISPEDGVAFETHLGQVNGSFLKGFELQGVRKDGTTLPLEMSAGKLGVDGDEKYTLVMRDISERAHFLDRLRGSERMEAVGQLAGGVAHDFNNVLTIINTHAYLLQVDGDSEETRGQYVDKILSAAERGARLTSQLLTLSPASMAEASNVILNDVVTNLNELFESVIEEDIELVLELADDIHPVKADLGQMEQIILNLIINARDAMPQGGKITIVTCNERVDNSRPGAGHLRDLEPGDYVVVEVHDTGKGIPQGIREYIFEPYFTTKEPGTGLGLATVYGIVQRHGGTIGVQSTMGVGSSFFVYLPALMAEETKEAPLEQRVSDGESMEGKTILLVEDEEDVRVSLCIVLRQDGYEVLEAADGESALEIAEEHEGDIDILLTDLIMPGINGVELAERISAVYPGVRTIYVSGYAGETLERKEIDSEAARLVKPYDPERVKETIWRVMGAPRPS